MLNLKGPCEIHGRFSRCKDAPVGICVYCGRRFCNSHGERLPDLSEVCNRDNCVAKKLDVAAHLVYKDAAMDRNRSEGRPCGIDTCAPRFRGPVHALQGLLLPQPHRGARRHRHRRRHVLPPPGAPVQPLLGPPPIWAKT